MEQNLYGTYGSTDEENAQRVRGTGGNAIWFHGFQENGFDSARAAGVAPCVEFKTFRAGFEEHPELIPTGVDGKPIRYGRLVQGICLSRHEYVDERMTDLTTGMKQFSPHGVWLDYLTYAGWFEVPDPDLQESCFCPDCVREFCESEEIDADSPQEILDRHQDVWTRHKCVRIDRLGRRFADIIRSADPNCTVGIYMCPWTPDEFDGALSRIFAQDYDLFGQWTDVFTPLMYAQKSGRPNEWSRSFLESTPDFVPDAIPVMPILDVLDFPESVTALAKSSVLPAGFQLFAGAKAFAEPDGLEIIREAIKTLETA